MIGYLLTGLAIGALAVSLLILRRQIAVVTVEGPSMAPTLNPGDRVLLRRAGQARLRTGQIVVIKRPGLDGIIGWQPPGWPPANQAWMIKRVAAMPGEPTPPAMLAAAAQNTEPIVPAGKLVILGDNPAASVDSRLLGYVQADRVLGTVIRVLPRSRTGDVSHSSLWPIIRRTASLNFQGSHGPFGCLGSIIHTWSTVYSRLALRDY